MLTKIDKLIQKLLPNLPEYNELVQGKKELMDYITTTAWEILNDKEKYLYEHYSDSVLFQEKIDMFGEYSFTNSEEEELRACERYSDFWDYNDRAIDFPNSKIPVLIERKRINTLPTKIRNTIFNLCNKNRNRFINFNERISQIEHILKSPEITLTLLKKHFPELYTLYKSL